MDICFPRLLDFVKSTLYFTYCIKNISECEFMLYFISAFG